MSFPETAVAETYAEEARSVKRLRAELEKAESRFSPKRWPKVGELEVLSRDEDEDDSARRASLPYIYRAYMEPSDYDGFVEMRVPACDAALDLGGLRVALSGLSDEPDLPMDQFEDAPFGNLRTGQTEHDPAVRLAKRFPGGRLVGVNFATLLTEIQQRLTNGAPVELVPHGVNVYGPGGHFDWHVDTPRNPKRMVGTVIVILPFKFDGGALQVKVHEYATNTHIRYWEDIWPRKNQHFLAVAMHGTCPHRVSEVTRGRRVTVTYDIHLKGDDLPPAPPRLTPPLETLVAAVRRDAQASTLGMILHGRYTPASLTEAGLAKDTLDLNLYRALAAEPGLRVWFVSILVDYEYEAWPGGDVTKQRGDVHLYGRDAPPGGWPEGITFVLPADTDGAASLEIPGKCLKHSYQAGAEYTGNEALPESSEGVYLSAAVVVQRAAE